MSNNGIITIAIGKKYINQAKYLAKSCIINTPHTLRAVITDLPKKLHPYFDIIIPWNSNDDPFSLKTRLFELSPFDKTLFLDADSLVFHNIDNYWYFLDESFYVYYGKKLKEGNWYFDINKVCKLINVSWIPIFNSGMILFKKCIESKNIFDTSKLYFFNHLEKDLNIPAFRNNKYPDEPAIAISLAKYNIEPINDFGRFSRTLIKAKHIRLNILKRIAYFIKDDNFVYPLVVHFCGRKAAIYYFIEKLRLFLHFLPDSIFISNNFPTPPNSQF